MGRRYNDGPGSQAFLFHVERKLDFSGNMAYNKPMNLTTVSVTRASQVEPGVFYLVCGTTGGGKLPIPPQLIQVISRPVSRTLLGDAMFDVQMWIDGGPGCRIAQTVTMGLWDVNVPEHGLHDRHLRRVSDEVVTAVKELNGLNRKIRYEDLARDLSMYRGKNGR